MKYGPYFAIFIVAAVAAYAAAIGFGSMSFKQNLAELVVTHLLALMFFALLIERAVEVIVNNKFIKRELEINSPVVTLKRKCAILQAALDAALLQTIPDMSDQTALADANAAKNENIAHLRGLIASAKRDKIAADQAAMPLREELGTEKAAFAATTATILGGLVALTGTTVLAEFVDISAATDARQFFGLFDQPEFFVAVDILFTALILAGGSEGIHQIVKGFLSARDDLALT
ncbi:hypothetical protein So717_37580 [Roseobacter cerasinus]|uniref:Uncharacterized protein n=1 Tax=Roseobacter cerasinus TaxID=2602289 RepID=A0A640VYI7_9RHOB|nr:hypothetical protein [Roseobacter cerasinus]GFE52005.1 hypothetical protein So717_37580 [Roseobacter cerasinus]